MNTITATHLRSRQNCFIDVSRPGRDERQHNVYVVMATIFKLNEDTTIASRSEWHKVLVIELDGYSREGDEILQKKLSPSNVIGIPTPLSCPEVQLSSNS